MPDTKSQFEPPPSIELSVTSMSCWVASKKLSQPRFFILKLFLSKNITSVYFQVGLERLAHHGSGLFTVSVCVMSNFSKSRVLSLQVVVGKYFLSTWSRGEYFLPTWSSLLLQILTRMCSLPAGHRMVADAISMLRLRFGEPVRFKFIVGGLDSG